MSRLWVKAHRNHKIIANTDAACPWGEQAETLREVLRTLDYPCPMWLPKHEREFDSFRRTIFLPEHFVEDVPFDMLEVEFLEDTGEKRKSRDPRNHF